MGEEMVSSVVGVGALSSLIELVQQQF